MTRQALLSALLSGFLLGLTTLGNGQVYHLHWAIFFGFVPLWASWLKSKKAKEVFLSGWVCQITFTLIAFHWLAYTIHEYAHVGWPLALLVLLLFCALANLQFPLAGLVWHKLFRHKNLSVTWQILALALLTATFQRLLTAVFHWNFGYAWLYMGWPGAQVAEWVGFRWLCTFSIYLNGLLLLAWLNRKNKNGKKYVFFTLAAFLLVNGMGWWRLRSLPPPDAVARVLLVQPNIGNREKEKLEKDQTFREVALARYYRLTDEALRQPVTSLDFVLWPENAFPGIIGERELKFSLGPSLRKYLSSRKIPLVTGSYGIDGDFKITNALFALTKEGVWSSPPYHKRILLPFGEFVPGAEIFPFLKNWFPDVREFGRGGSLRLLEIGGIRLGPQICYEGLFDSVSRDLANAGTQIIVNVTNDSWYGSWQEPWQHFYITMAKAIETRRPLLRGTNTGVSGVALADGTITRISPVATEWFGLEEIPYRRNPEPTLFMGWGFWFDWIFIGLGLLLVLIRRNLFSVANRL